MVGAVGAGAGSGGALPNAIPDGPCGVVDILAGAGGGEYGRGAGAGAAVRDGTGAAAGWRADGAGTGAGAAFAAGVAAFAAGVAAAGLLYSQKPTPMPTAPSAATMSAV